MSLLKSESPKRHDPDFAADPELGRAFADYDRSVTISNIKVGCYLGIILMPLGALLDAAVYPDYLTYFLRLRLLSSLLIAIFWGIVCTSWGHHHHRSLGVALAMIPSGFITWMIYKTDGAESSYYAGLILVVLLVGLVLHWTHWESFTAVSLVIVMYLVACYFNSSPGSTEIYRRFINNFYFLLLTGVIVITGCYFHSRLRFREFALRFELDKNQKMLAESNRKLVELDQIKSRFFANISHELRTPLTLLLAPLESLLTPASRQNPETMSEAVRTMHVNGMRLLKLINDLLDLVRLESGRMEVSKDPLDLNEFLQGLVQSVKKVADDKRIQLTAVVEDPRTVINADRDKLEKILLNLVFNAIKFTPAGGKVGVEASKVGEELLLRVTDTGMGISPEQANFIFDRFWQADTSSQRKFQGTGIGLALVKELTEVQQGRVEVTSEVGRGSVISVWLPYEVAPPGGTPVVPMADISAGEGEEREQWLLQLYRRAEMFPALTTVRESMRANDLPEGAGPKILIADDEPDMLRFLKGQLTGHFSVIEAVDGPQAIEKALQFLPEMILLDMMMPEKDGLEVCRELRARTPTQSIPILLLTARADEETKLAALAAGASDFLSKPFSTTELHVRLTNLVRSYQRQKSLIRQKQILESTLEQLKETETQLVQSAKLASLGRMSAGIIHEINNPINFAKSGLFLLRRSINELPEERRADFEEVLTDVEEGIDRVKNIVTDLRGFTHPQQDQVEPVSLTKVVSAALRFLSQEWKDRIHVEQVAPSDVLVMGNYNQLVQVVINLLQNGFDAVIQKHSGAKDAEVRIEIGGDDDRARLVVRDNGGGIPAENINKVFDPFFTTKDIGSGTGLGLSICYRIMENHRGRILVRSEPGEFSEFRLEFPALREEPETKLMTHHG